MASTSRVTSTKSDRVSSVRVLHTRAGRRKAGRFVVEGPQAVRSAVAAGVRIHELFVDEDAGGAFSDVVGDVETRSGHLIWTTPEVMAALSETRAPQGILAVCDLLSAGRPESVMAADGPVVVLESVSDPGNVGTIIRTADAMSAAGVLLTPDCADVHNGKVVRSTAGSLFHLPVVIDQALPTIVEAAHAHGRVVAVATGDAPLDLFAAAESGRVGAKTCWIIGSEAHGVSRNARDLADIEVSIPMTGRAESLNAAVAASVLLYVTAFTSRLGR